MSAYITLLYGDEKAGKTTAAVAAYPRAQIVGVRANIELGWRQTLGLPTEIDGKSVMRVTPNPPEDLEELIDYLTGAKDWKPEIKELGIIVDDAGKLVKATYMRFDQSPEATSAKTGKKDNFYAGKMVTYLIQELCQIVRYAGIPLVMLFHAKAGKTDQATGEWLVGGPDLPWRGQAKELLSSFDLNLFVYGDPDSLDPWFGNGKIGRAFYHVPFDRNWRTGDRAEVCWDKTPGSLYEVLRAAGAPVKRFAIESLGYDLSWQDELAEDFANALLSANVTNRAGVINLLDKSFRSAYVEKDKLHRRTAFQDGIARYLIRARQGKDLFDFDNIPTSTKGGGAGSGSTKLPPQSTPDKDKKDKSQ